MLTLFILIYLVSLLIHIIMCYKENKRRIFYVKDVLDEIEFYMWAPIVNTLCLFIVIIVVFIVNIWKLLKLDILWEKFRNIKLR